MEIIKLSIDTHEAVYHILDDRYGLDAIVAVHNTALGPALGGCRQMSYDSFEDHLEDALMLSEGMTYKNAIAGLELGGGKAVINNKNLSEGYLKSYADALNVINADKVQYITAGDVGTSNEHLQEIAEHTGHVNGYNGTDSGQATAYGVLNAMRGALDHHAKRWEKTRVAIAGLGKVGMRLADFLLEKGCTVYAYDPSREAQDIAIAKGIYVFDNMDDLMLQKADVYAPCALGKAITYEVAINLPNRSIICGGANNQIDPADAEDIYEVLSTKQIAYVPDFVANAGGVIIIAKRGHKYVDIDWDHVDVKPKLENIKYTVRTILSNNFKSGTPTEEIAVSMAKRRTCSV